MAIWSLILKGRLKGGCRGGIPCYIIYATVFWAAYAHASHVLCSRATLAASIQLNPAIRHQILVLYLIRVGLLRKNKINISTDMYFLTLWEIFPEFCVGKNIGIL